MSVIGNQICTATYNANGDVTSITVVQKNSYYPFGLLHSGKNTIATNKYLYNGKELQTDYNFDLYSLSRCIGNYGFRFYDGQLGRFLTQSRFSSKVVLPT